MTAKLETWPLSRKLLQAILNDYISDKFVAELVWYRLGYEPVDPLTNIWLPTENTAEEWKQNFPQAPEIIANRKASVYLTRSILKENKQLLKQKLDFRGYKIGQLYPRRTRRATAVNWLLAWLQDRGDHLPVDGPIPRLLSPPSDPIRGHQGDPLVE